MGKLYFEVIILLSSFIVFCFGEYVNINNCVVNIEDTEIKINSLNKVNGYEISSGKNTYILNICGPALKCENPNASACVINEKKEIQIIVKAVTLIEFKCNRHLKTPFIEYISKTDVGKKHTFIFYTSLMCVKLRTITKVYNVENNLEYDITSLYNPKYNWTVKNVSEGVKIYLTLGGDLHIISEVKHKECNYEGTQICLVDRYGKATNLGVFSSTLEPSDNGLTLQFTDGSLCTNLSSIVTKLNFICSINETGPILESSSACEYNIIWNTPSACPYYSSINKDCILSNTLYGMQNEPLYLLRDKEQKLPKNMTMKYNICGVLTSTCNGRKNVSMCLINNNEEIVFGVGNNTIMSRDASVYMNLIGEICDKKVHRITNIQFRCDYTLDKSEKIAVSDDLCTANVTVFTTKVCRKPDASLLNCKTPVNNSQYYDLSPLILKDHNYEITDTEDPSKIYLLNVCQPIVFNSNALCASGSAVCLRNNAEPNRYQRFKSLGNLMKSTELVIESDKLILRYENGVICPVLGMSNYEAVIEFRCIPSTEVSRIKLLKSGCQYNFIWETQYACPIRTIDTNSTLKNISLETEENTEKYAETEDGNINKNHSELTTEVTQVAKQINKENSELQLQSQNNELNTPVISMYVPTKVANSSGIFIKNCTLKNNFHEFNMTGIPRVSYALSTSGKKYSVNICNQQTQAMCTSMRCLTNLHIALDKKFIILNFTDWTKCSNSSYKSVIILKCSKEFTEPEVIKEQECDVEIEWKNEIACPFFQINSKDTEPHSSTTVIIVVPIIATILIIILILVSYYFIKKRRVSDSSLELVRCEYSRVKESVKMD